MQNAKGACLPPNFVRKRNKKYFKKRHSKILEEKIMATKSYTKSLMLYLPYFFFGCYMVGHSE